MHDTCNALFVVHGHGNQWHRIQYAIKIRKQQVIITRVTGAPVKVGPKIVTSVSYCISRYRMLLFYPQSLCNIDEQ
jgi:hypothetical protein